MMNSLQNANDKFVIKISNSGGYMADFYISYQIGDTRYEPLESGTFGIGSYGVISIPKNAQMIYLEVDIWIFGGLRHLVKDYIQPGSHCYNLTGTIFDAVMNEVPCNLLGNSNSTNNNQPINRCCRCCCCCCRKPRC